MYNILNIYKYFPQPVFHFKVDNFKKHNNDLAKYIYDLQKKDPKGVARSNINGWHSKSFDLKDKNTASHKFFIEIQKYVADVFIEYGWRYGPNQVKLTEMWAIINKKGAFNTMHTHPNHYLSAAYYVKAPKNCGKFQVINPNQVQKERFPPPSKVTEFNRAGAQIVPNEGDLLIFPAYLPHSVGINESSDDRVVISFNIDIIK